MSVQGRVQSDHGRLSPARRRLVPGSVAPDASNTMPRAAARASASRMRPSSVLSRRSNSACSGRARPWAVGEIDQALQMHFANIDVVRKIDERGELGDGFL